MHEKSIKTKYYGITIIGYWMESLCGSFWDYWLASDNGGETYTGRYPTNEQIDNFRSEVM